DGMDEVSVGTPRARYPVGARAPVTVDPDLLVETGPTKEAESTTNRTAGNPGDDGQVISDVDKNHLSQQGVPVETDAATGTADDDEDRDEGPKGGLTHPSSMGLRFQVPRDIGLLTVTASWGRYEGNRRENSEGRKVLYSQRVPFERSAEIDVRGYSMHAALDPIQLDLDVTLRVELFPLGERTIVEVALSNDRVTGMDAPPKDWLFQTKLRVEAASGDAVFLPTRDVMDDGYDEQDDEKRRLDLQYRHRLEFAVGRTCSATWGGDGGVSGLDTTDSSSLGSERLDRPGMRRARWVETTWLPTVDVAQTVPGGAAGAVTSMKALAELEAGDAEAAFGPLIGGYAEWLAEQQEGADG